MRARALAVALLAAACGYAPARRSAGTLQIPPVHNRTAQAEAGGIVQAALRARFAAGHRLAEEGAPAPELAAELLALRTLPAFCPSPIQLQAELHLRAPSFDEVIVLGEGYPCGIDVLGTEANRRAALHRLADRLADEAFQRLAVSERFAAQAR